MLTDVPVVEQQWYRNQRVRNWKYVTDVVA